MNKSEEKIYELLKNSDLYRDEKGIYTIFPQEYLIEKSGKSERTVQYTLKSLETQGYIRREWLANEHLNLFYLLKEDFSGRHIHDRTENSDNSVMKKISTQNVVLKNCTHYTETTQADSKNCTHYTETTQADSKNCTHYTETTQADSENVTSYTEITQAESSGDLTNTSCKNEQERNSGENSQNDEAPSNKKLSVISRVSTPGKYYLPTFKLVDLLFHDFPIGQTKRVRAESEKDRKKGKTADILLLLNFDELKGVQISRELTVYDQQVWNACANLTKCGYSTITPTHIYKFMGYKEKLNARDREKILESVKTISRARVFINNKEENELYKKYPLISLDAPLLSATICTAISGNNEVVDAIEISEIPKLFTIAEQRGQVTTIPFAVVEIPVISKTDDNLQLLFYLIKRIVYMKHDSTTSKKILFNSVYDKCNIEEYKQRQRLPEKLEKIFDYYKSIGWISGYKITDQEIQIEIPSKK